MANSKNKYYGKKRKWKINKNKEPTDAPEAKAVEASFVFYIFTTIYYIQHNTTHNSLLYTKNIN